MIPVAVMFTEASFSDISCLAILNSVCDSTVDDGYSNSKPGCVMSPFSDDS